MYMYVRCTLYMYTPCPQFPHYPAAGIISFEIGTVCCVRVLVVIITYMYM